MLSSLNSFGGLSAAEILMLFGANSSSSSSPDSASASKAQSASSNVDTSGANNPLNAIQAILAQAELSHAQLETSLGESGSTVTAQAAYDEQTGDSSSLVSASVTISSPGAIQQIADAVSTVNNHVYINIPLSPTSSLDEPLEYLPDPATVANAVNVTINGGYVVATTGFSGLLPSLTSIQGALDNLKAVDEGSAETEAWNLATAAGANPQSADNSQTIAKDAADALWNSASNGSFTLVQLPQNTWGETENMTTFESNGSMWALVLPQTTVSVSLSDTQTTG